MAKGSSKGSFFNNDIDLDDASDGDDDDSSGGSGSVVTVRKDGMEPNVRRFLISNRFAEFVDVLFEDHDIATMADLSVSFSSPSFVIMFQQSRLTHLLNIYHPPSQTFCDEEDATETIMGLGMAKLKARALVDMVTNERNPKSPRNVAKQQILEKVAAQKRNRPLSTIERVKARRDAGDAKKRALEMERLRKRNEFAEGVAAKEREKEKERAAAAERKDTPAYRAARERYHRPTGFEAEAVAAREREASEERANERRIAFMQAAAADSSSTSSSSSLSYSPVSTAESTSPTKFSAVEKGRAAAREDRLFAMQAAAEERRRDEAQRAAAAAAARAAVEAEAERVREAEKAATLARLGLR